MALPRGKRDKKHPIRPGQQQRHVRADESALDSERSDRRRGRQLDIGLAPVAARRHA